MGSLLAFLERANKTEWDCFFRKTLCERGICKECALSDKLLQGFSFFRIVKGKLKSGRSEIVSVLFLHSFVVYFSKNAESLKSALYQRFWNRQKNDKSFTILQKRQ